MGILYTTRQVNATKILLEYDGGFIWWRVGTGKTRIAFLWFAMLAKRIEVPNPVFVVVCRRHAFQDWWEEAKLKLKFKWTICNYETYPWPKRNRPTVLLVSHGMLHKILPDLMEHAGVLEAVIYDEGFLYKNSQTNHCKSANKLSSRIGRSGIMSGSVMTAKNIEDIYGQTFAINQHKILAPTLTDFRSRFQFSLDLGSSGRKLLCAQAGAKKRIMSYLRPRTSIFFPDSEREIRHIHRRVEPNAKQSKYISALKQEYYLDLKEQGQLEIKNTPSLIIKCQQISDGYIKLQGSEGGVIQIPSEKQTYLLEMLQELMAAGEKVIIWCAFRETVAILLQRLQKLYEGVYELVGGKRFDVAGWRRNGRVVVGTEDSGSSVNHFDQCAHSIYFSMSWKWLSLQQSRGRSDRKSSKHQTAFYYYLFTKGSLDEFVYNTAVKSGKAEKELIDQKEIKSWLTHDTLTAL